MQSESDPVLVRSTNEGITTITINRPYRRNAVDPSTAQILYEKILAFENDPSQKVCILTGVGSTFCAGADLHEVAGQGNSDKATKGGRGHFQAPPKSGERSLGPMGPSRLHIQKPIIGAVAGHAVAGGLELSLLCDIRVVEEDAVFGVFCRRWGVPLIDGGTVRLQAIVGLGRALDMILTGRPVSATEAFSMGLANRVVAKGKAVEEATAIAKQLLSFPQLCMNTDRGSCYYSAYQASSFQDALRQEYEKGVEVLDLESIKGATKFSRGAGRHGSFKNSSHL
ncbi:enoyl-CoA hydratase/isomerase family protein [Aspergillus alliaceus]|uniref:Enoyl-CoA hydratase/isomerase family protein n=1 Tax=Petromyces alliaceus TaxID=209559 RepID=A0A5N6G3V2_PETAA|nr:enoyl-CoA hydratase/isomerase family protein [Aspergillus alliaceus]KAB8237031.1 enoyl-CoA hydratase/isomerase family protein [Aspergillus alliaceus]KAE8390926.1 enoyl-CoA hydratase/isomerase family protein [Aspergillus alliaceus]